MIDDNNAVSNIVAADEDWINEHRSELPTGWRYVDAHTELENRGAGMGFTYDEETTWFIPICNEPDWYFDRDLWMWIDPNPPEPDEEPGEPE